MLYIFIAAFLVLIAIYLLAMTFFPIRVFQFFVRAIEFLDPDAHWKWSEGDLFIYNPSEYARKHRIKLLFFRIFAFGLFLWLVRFVVMIGTRNVP